VSMKPRPPASARPNARPIRGIARTAECNRNATCSAHFVLTRFLHANRSPLRVKTLWSTAPSCQREGKRLRLRDDIMAVERFAELRMRSDLGIANAQTGIARSQAQAVLACAARDRGDTLAPQTLIGMQGRSDLRAICLGEDRRQRHAILD